MSKEFWDSSVTKDMITHLTKKEKDELLEALNDAVMHVCEDFEVA